MSNPLKDLNAQRPTEVVEIRGAKILVVGLAGGDIGQLVERFPELVRMFVGGTVDPAVLVAKVPQAVPAIIAAGFRKMGDPETEADAAALQLDDWISLVEGVLKATMPEGPRPLRARFEAALNRIAPADESALIKKSATRSRS